MFRSLGRFGSIGWFKSMYFLLILGLSAGAVWADDDISLSKVPAAVRATIEREAKGYKIDDIERDKDDGIIVYKVDIKKNDDDDIKLKVATDGKLLEKEEELQVDDLPAVIVEAAEKSVPGLDIDDAESRTKSDGRLKYKVEGQTDDMDVELEIAPDGTILDKDINYDDDDDDMPDDFRDVRDVFIKVRNQIKLAAIGDSRVEKGIDTRLFYGEKNKKYPIAINFGMSSTGLPLHSVIVDDYLIHAPNLEWVVYGISPRIFNSYYRSEDGRGIKRSKIYKLDKSPGTIWQHINTKPVAASDIDDDDSSPWGLFDGEEGMDDHFTDSDDREDILDDLEKGRYRFNEKRYKALESMIQLLAKHNVKMLGFTPPMHPISKGQPCADDDGTTRKGYDLFVEKMKNLDHKYPNFYFFDIDNKGDHSFKYNEFNTFDHLNIKGARRLTLMLDDLIKGFDLERKKNIVKKRRH